MTPRVRGVPLDALAPAERAEVRRLAEAAGKRARGRGKAPVGPDRGEVGPRGTPKSRKPQNANKRVPSEHEEQAALVARCDAWAARYPELGCLLAVPNGGHRAKRTAAKMRLEGVRAGVPDLFLAVPRAVTVLGVPSQRAGLWIEMKRRNASPSAVKASQTAWHDRLREQGYVVKVCRGCEEAWDVIVEYLQLPTHLRGATPAADAAQEAA